MCIIVFPGAYFFSWCVDLYLFAVRGLIMITKKRVKSKAVMFYPDACMLHLCAVNQQLKCGERHQIEGFTSQQKAMPQTEGMQATFATGDDNQAFECSAINSCETISKSKRNDGQ